ncbi:MAG: O-antigen ligase family protein [Clostridia bacterium]|nr:O-antigen ligase family protein [Clostridia bacterium]
MRLINKLNLLIGFLVDELRDNLKIKKIAYYLVAITMFLYTVSIPAFSGRAKIYIISYVLMALFAAATLFYVFVYDKFSFQKRHLISVLFALEAFIGTAIYSHDFRRWLSIFLMVITLFVYYFAFSAINNSRFSLKIIIFSFAVFALYFVIVYRNQILHLQISNRIGDYFDNPNAVGSYFSLAFSTSTYVAVMFEKKRELLYLIPSAIFVLCGIFTGSRTFIVLIVASLSVIVFIRFRTKKWLLLIVYALLVGLFFILINLPAFATLKMRVDQMLYTLFGIGNSKIDHSSIHRVLWQRYGYYLASHNLIFGYGCEGFSIYSGIGTYSHSNFSEVLCNFGIIGFSLFYACYLVPFLYCFGGKQKDRFAVIVFVIYFLFKGFIGVSYYYKESYLIIALCMYLTKDSNYVFKPHSVSLNECCEVSI